MATTGNDSRTNFPREFTKCPNCEKKGFMQLKGQIIRDGDRVGGYPPSSRCKYCGHREWDVPLDEFRRRLQEGVE